MLNNSIISEINASDYLGMSVSSSKIGAIQCSNANLFFEESNIGSILGNNGEIVLSKCNFIKDKDIIFKGAADISLLLDKETKYKRKTRKEICILEPNTRKKRMKIKTKNYINIVKE